MTAAPEQRPASIPPSPLLTGKIAAVRSKHTNVAAGSGLAMLIGGLTLALAAGMLLDWWLDFPWAVRFLCFLGYLAAAGHIIWHHILTPCLRRPDDDATALLVQRGMPQFGSRLIAALQLTRPGALQAGEAPALVRALVAETERIAEPIDFCQVISTRELRRLAGWAVVIVGIAAVLFFRGEEVSRDLLRRAFLSREVEVPRKTRIATTSGDLRLARGDNASLFALAKGAVPNQGKLVLKFASGRTQEFLLDGSKTNAAHFALTLENAQDSFDYTFHIGDGKRSARVEVVDRPTVARIEATQVYPEYTGLGTVRRSLGDLTLLVGSKLNVTIQANKEIARGAVRLSSSTNSSPQDIPLKAAGMGGKEFTVTLPIASEALTGFAILLEDKYGFRSKDDALYRLDVLPDRAPVVRITYPERKEELITQKATVLVGFEAVDDFGIAQLSLRYTVDGGEEKAVQLVLEGPAQRSLRRRYEWKVGALNPRPPEGSMLEYWIEARDNNNVTGPGIGTSEHFSAKVVSDAEKRADLLNRVGDSIGAIGEAANDQEKLNQRLGDIIQGRPERK